MQRGLTHQIGTHARELALWQVREFFIKGESDDAIKNAVANELKALIVRCAKTSMSERLSKETRFAKGVPEGGFKTQS